MTSNSQEKMFHIKRLKKITTTKNKRKFVQNQKLITDCIQPLNRLRNSPYFCVLFKYARAVKQKVWNKAENSERDREETLKIRTVRFAYAIFSSPYALRG